MNCLGLYKENAVLKAHSRPSLMVLVKCNLKQLTQRKGSRFWSAFCSLFKTNNTAKNDSSLHRQNAH